MQGNRPIHHLVRATATALGLIAATVPGFAQSAGSAAGSSGTLPTSPGGTGLGPAAEPPLGILPPAAIRPNTGRRPPRPATRRAANPTSALAGVSIRPTLTAPGTVADVQPQLNGPPPPPLATAPTLAPAISVAATPLRRRPLDEDPYAPLGIRLGGTMLYPAIGQSIGYDTNPNRVTSQRGSFVSQTEAELGIRSDWSRHELNGYLRGAYNEYPSVEAASRPEGAGRLGLRLDVARDTTVDIAGRYAIDTQRGDSANLASAVRERPLVFSEGASLGVTQRFNRLVASLQGTIDRTDFEDAIAVGGGRIDQQDRNVTQYGARGRLAYELKPGFAPFVEALGDTRVYDQRIDDSGFARSSDGVGGRVGTTFELTRLITGEIGAGAVRRTYEDRRLGTLTAPLADLSLAWALSPLTTIRATGSATVDETTVLGANGVRTLRGTLEVAHALRRNLIVTAGLTAVDYEYNGVNLNEHGFGANARVDYKLNRELGIRASYAYERLDSQFFGSSYVANVFLLGMRYTP